LEPTRPGNCTHNSSKSCRALMLGSPSNRRHTRAARPCAAPERQHAPRHR
jgi:hypothetical protein